MPKVYKYMWGNNSKRLTMKGRICNIIAYGGKNSMCIEFVDNKQREIVSRNSVRLVDHKENEWFNYA